MILSTLHLRNFRNHSDTTIDCGRGLNFLLGNNGQGKTNVVEGISYLCLTKSFYAGSDSQVLKIGEGMFEAEGRFTSDDGRPSEVRAAYLGATGEKHVTINRRKVDPLSSMIGSYPVVIFSPEHAAITTGGPSARRRFLDLAIAQSSSSYVRAMVGYRGVLRQRNRVLLDAKFGRDGGTEFLEPWDEQLVAYGSEIWAARARFVAEFEPIVREVYARFVDGTEVPSMRYGPPATAAGATPSAGDAADAFRRELRAKARIERRFGTSLVGPHRDEVSLRLNGLEMRTYASQGQHKTFVIALKLAEFLYLRERCGETPLLLLDDVFAELDDDRTARVVGAVENMGQIFLTSTHRHLLGSWNSGREDCRWFLIEAGAVAEQRAEHHA